MKDVVIKIVGSQDYGPDNTDAVELVTDGKYKFSQEAAEIHYSESALTGLEGTETYLTVHPSHVTLRREGSLTSTADFRVGERSSFLMDTPYGKAILGVDTRKIVSNMDEHGGSLIIDYVVDMDHAAFGRNCFQIYVSEQEKEAI